MPPPSDQNDLRNKILGMGEFSMRKSYYPVLQERIQELALYKTLLNEAHDAIGLVDLTTFRFVDLNNSGRKWFAASPDEPLPLLTAMFAPEISDEIQRWRQAIDNGGERVLRLTAKINDLGKNNSAIYADLNLSYVHYDNCDYAVAVLRDVTERRQAEINLRDSEQRYKGLVSSVPIGICVVAKRVIIEVNQRFCDIIGYTREELIGQSTAMLYLDDDTFRRTGPLITEIMKQNNDNNLLEMSWKRKDGRIIDSLITFSLLKEDDPEAGIIHSVMDITDRKQAEKALLASENTLKSIVNAAPVGIILAHNRIIKEVNPKLCEITGYSRNELLEETSRKFYLNDEQFESVGRQIYINNQPAGSAQQVNTQWRHKDGHIIDIAIYLTPHSGTEKISGTTFIIMDVTEQKKAEEALKASESKLKSIISAVPTGIGVVENRVFLEANTQMCELSGYSRDELLGQNSRMLYVSQEEYERVGKQFYSQFSKGANVIATDEVHWIRKDGTPIDVLMSLTPVDPNRPNGPVTFSLLDITARKKAEAALKTSEENLRITLNSIGDAVIASDCAGRITRLNPVAANLTGWNVEDAIGQPIEKVFSIINGESRAPLESPIHKVIETGQVQGLMENTVLVARDGREFNIADSGAPIRNDRGEITGMVLVFHDITRQYELEEKLRQAQKMESIGKLAGGVAHDFNNMLTGIMASADLLTRRIDPNNAGAATLVGIIRDSCQKAADLTQKLLAFARKAKLVSRPVEIHAAIGTAISLLERSIDRRIEIVSHFNAPQSTITGDPSQMANMFLNLGVNSRDAMPDGGVIMIETENIRLDSEQCKHFAFNLTPGTYLHIRFCDTGSGIPPEIINRIFEPFFTTKEVGKGSGLGLSAVYGAIQEHNGAIEVESSMGKGTSFDIYLPCSNSVAIVEQKTEAFPQGHGCILIIDDEELVRYTAKEIMEEIGFSVFMASDGLDGLEKYKAHQNEIDLVILDMIMPKMNGRECFVELRKLNPKVKVVISTGYISDRTTNAAYPDGAAGFIRKPFTISELHKEINRALAAKA